LGTFFVAIGNLGKFKSVEFSPILVVDLLEEQWLMVLLAWMGVNGADALLTALSIALGVSELNSFLDTIGLALGTQTMLVVKLCLALSIGGLLQCAGHQLRIGLTLQP
jgi:hypothetical protein